MKTTLIIALTIFFMALVGCQAPRAQVSAIEVEAIERVSRTRAGLVHPGDVAADLWSSLAAHPRSFFADLLHIYDKSSQSTAWMH